jgi:uncharacterized protein YjaG (DUF416 family)
MYHNNYLLLELIKKLTYKQAILFCYLNCIELYKNYEDFCLLEKWGNTVVMKELIKKGDDFLNDGREFQIEECIERLYSISPDTEVFPSVNAIYALDSCSAVYNMLYYIVNKDIEHVYSVSDLCFNSAYIFAINKKGDFKIELDFEEEVLNSDIMIQEQLRQENLITKILNS